jgi:hypothetical protein
MNQDIKNITDFEVGTIVTKVVQREHITLSRGIFEQKPVAEFDRSFMLDFYKILGFGNNVAYVEKLTGYSKNTTQKVDLDRYSDNWQEIQIPYGMTLEQVLSI